MEYLLSFLLFSFLLLPQDQEKSLCKNGEYILKRSKAFHDPAGEWDMANLELELREPRIQGAGRFSNVSLDNTTNAFSMERNRGAHTSLHLINAQGEASTLLDNEVVSDTAKIKEFFLQPERNTNYRRYYQFFYGLPMNLTKDYATLKKVGEQELNGQKLISIDFELKQSMIAKTWRVFFSPDDYRVAGVQTMDEAPGEYLIFNGEAKLGNITVPRFRHWYDSKDHTYLGSDILINGKLVKSGK